MTGATGYPYEKSNQHKKGHEKQNKDDDWYTKKDARQISNTKVKEASIIIQSRLPVPQGKPSSKLQRSVGRKRHRHRLGCRRVT
jgi:hypothetical protein